MHDYDHRNQILFFLRLRGFSGFYSCLVDFLWFFFVNNQHNTFIGLNNKFDEIADFCLGFVGPVTVFNVLNVAITLDQNTII